MATFPYALPAELIALREQVRRIVRDELLPIEPRIDPDARRSPRKTIAASPPSPRPLFR